ncbi:sodium/panthothenate symporter [Klebsiella pneumoniae]|uniref:Sodium/panthothenate symporter n=2 Tax=Gammaproteobacteria TaxID=1236 RepID=A0A447RSY3_KLEPN|nr:sodium/panthothenate symporter [Klebsiella pneumoniae]
MDKRFVQAHKEARWALWLTLLYLAALAGRRLSAGVAIGFTGLPHWFEMACLLVPLLFILLCWAMVKLISAIFLWRTMMQFEVIIPLIAYLVVVFGLSLYAMRKRASGSFLNEYFLGSRSMGGFVLAMTLTATYISASSFIGGPGAAYKYGLGWVLLAMIQLPAIWLSLGVLGKNSPSLRVAIMLSPSMTCCLRAIRVACWSGWPA